MPTAKFGNFSFSCSGFIVQTERQTNKLHIALLSVELKHSNLAELYSLRMHINAVNFVWASDPTLG